MVEECIHILADGRKCRRIPKRRDKFCPAHRANRRRRRPLEEDHAFDQQMAALVDRLHAVSIDDLLYTTGELLNDIHSLIDRRCSRQDRAAFTRATIAVGVAAERIEDTFRGFRQQSASARIPSPQPPSPVPAQPSGPAPTTPIESLHAALRRGQPLSPEELANLCDRLASTLGSDTAPASFLDSNA